MTADEPISLAPIMNCFEGLIPAVIATASSDGTPNVTHLSKVHYVDDDHVGLSNQFFSKTVQNLAENPRASVQVVDPTTYSAWKLELRYERTERRGPVFDRMHRDIELVAALTGMSGVFKLKSADIYRVVDLEQVPTVWSTQSQ
jgi:predicted pyridoxine 5'-phosphate oxidase superfamily flavin-nucleotide-binding protein